MTYDDESELKAIKQQVDRRLWGIGLLGAHFVAWVAGSAIVAAVAPEAVDIVAPVWFGLVVLHGLLYFLLQKREHDIQAELRRREEMRYEGKLKRDRLYRLSDDGELVEVEDMEPDEVVAKS